MAELLVIRLNPAAASAAAADAQWLVVDQHGARVGTVQSGPLSDAAALTSGRRVIVLVPGTDVVLAEPVVPLKSGAKLAQVVPFALEEQLAEDIEQLHFAIGKRNGRPGIPVSVVAHQRMRQWLDVLAAAGIRADALYAETAALPEIPNAVALIIDGTRVYMRRENGQGAVLEVEPLIEALQLALASGDDEREHVTIYISEADYERERDLLEGLREFTASLQLKLMPDGPLPLMAANVASAAPVNLLQGPYAVKRKLTLSFAPWRYAASLAGIFVVLHFGLKGWQYWDNKQLEAALDREITQVFQQTMPGAPVPDPLQARRHVELRLNQLRGTAPVSGMLVTLAALSEALAQAPNTTVEAIAYRNNTTDVRLLAPSVDALDRIRQVATEKGLGAEIQSANPRDSKLEGRLQFKSSGA
ncbi:MAG: type II secretion system protein GspL [Gammaproteobacteria bacterium]|nr:type II secretion system protein GspL [Gammaproteobacteria bacterium]